MTGAILFSLTLLGASLELDAWRFKPAPTAESDSRDWCRPDVDDSNWDTIRSGVRWEEQGFDGVDGYAWYRHTADVPASWVGKPVWLVIGAVNDACAVFCNGTLVNTYGDHTDLSMYSTPVIAEIGEALNFGAANVIAVRVFDWGGSGGMWRPPCLLTNDIESLPIRAVISHSVDVEGDSVVFDVDLASLGNDHPGITVDLSAHPQRRSARNHIAAQGSSASLRLDLGNPRPGDQVNLRVTLSSPDGSLFAGFSHDIALAWPSHPTWPAPHQNLRILNNLVTELTSEHVKANTNYIQTIDNPRDGWVFVRVTSNRETEPPEVNLDSFPIPFRPTRMPNEWEAMVRIKQGLHTIEAQPASKIHMDVRAVPELTYSYYPASPNLKAFGEYDWDYVSRYVLPHVNTIMTSGAPEENFDEWLRLGGAWISNAGLPGLNAQEPPLPEDVVSAWMKNAVIDDTRYAGMIVDEFIPSPEPFYDAWTSALDTFLSSNEFNDKTFYAWLGGDVFRHPYIMDWCKRLDAQGGVFAWEKYIREEPTLEDAEQRIARELARPMIDWTQEMPGVQQRTLVGLGYLCAPPETLNVDPRVDYHVFMDMQFHRLATDPAFFGVFGIAEYTASYADEESLRYAHELMRHYAIEGSRKRYNADPLVLPHIKNPDFDDGLLWWRANPATDGGISTGSMEAFSWLQGRYPRTSSGCRFCVFTRNPTRPNRIRQTVHGLQPGRLYSVKAISADLDRWDVEQTIDLEIEVGGADSVDNFAIDQAYASNYAHEHGPYNRKHPAWFTFHRRVFRATAQTAELSISDWLGNQPPVTSATQRVSFNFVEVQPFHAPHEDSGP